MPALRIPRTQDDREQLPPLRVIVIIQWNAPDFANAHMIDTAPPNAVVLVSGGMDSAVTLAIAREQGFAVHALSVAYGQRHGSELEAAERVARALGARFVWTEREAGQMTLRRGFTIAPGEKTLIVEDVITTGGSTRDTIDAVRKAGADVVGAASIIDRSGGSADVSVPRVALATLKVLSVEPEICDACKMGEPAVKPGSRKRASSGTSD